MKIWLLDYHPSYNHFKISNMDDYERLTFNGTPLSEQWKAPEVILHENGKPSDIMGCHKGALLINQRAKDVFETTIHTGEAEFLPLEIEGAAYYFMHVLNHVSCIDAENSLIKRLNGSNIISEYTEYAFYEELVKPHNIMRVKFHEGDRVVNYPFVSDHIHEAIINSELKGYQLIEIWDSAFSWQDKQKKFNAMVQQSNLERIKTFNYPTARKYVEKRKITAYSDRWAMRLDDHGRFQLGELLLDGTYSWIYPIFIPPVLLGQVWGIKEQDQSGLLNRVVKAIFKNER
ncbi:imm11 family protein [Paenibacillus sp. MMO-58]|uniref:imm11 family protein n=1 Tax=Paenibacillus sp. MMO-58 TaxID=3081290 RepID=UPI00301A0B14